MRGFIGVAGTSVRNPMDVGMQLRGPEDFVRVLEIVSRDQNIDLIMMVMHVWARGIRWRGAATKMYKLLVRFAKEPHRQPFCVAIRSPSENMESERERLSATKRFLKADIPVFKTIERACRALHKYTGYYRNLAEIQNQ